MKQHLKKSFAHLQHLKYISYTKISNIAKILLSREKEKKE